MFQEPGVEVHAQYSTVHVFTFLFSCWPSLLLPLHHLSILSTTLIKKKSEQTLYNVLLISSSFFILSLPLLLLLLLLLLSVLASQCLKFFEIVPNTPITGTIDESPSLHYYYYYYCYYNN